MYMHAYDLSLLHRHRRAYLDLTLATFAPVALVLLHLLPLRERQDLLAQRDVAAAQGLVQEEVQRVHLGLRSSHRGLGTSGRERDLLILQLGQQLIHIPSSEPGRLAFKKAVFKPFLAPEAPVAAGQLHQLSGHMFRQLWQLAVTLQGLTSRSHPSKPSAERLRQPS